MLLFSHLHVMSCKLAMNNDLHFGLFLKPKCIIWLQKIVCLLYWVFVDLVIHLDLQGIFFVLFRLLDP